MNFLRKDLFLSYFFTELSTNRTIERKFKQLKLSKLTFEVNQRYQHSHTHIQNG